MSWSSRIGRIAGVTVRVHATFAVLLIWVAASSWIEERSIVAVVQGLVLILALFACVVLHELGHALAARRLGISTRDVILLPNGGVARLERIPGPRQELWIAIAGPAVNVVIAAVLAAMVEMTGGWTPLGELSPTGGTFFDRLLIANVFLALFNLIPALPLDGGRILRALLAASMGYGRATRVTVLIGQALAIYFIYSGWLINSFLVGLGVVIWTGASQEAAMARAAATALPSRGRFRWQMALPLPLLLALRYLKSSRRDAYVSFLSLLAGGGITLGVAALILVLAGLSGLQHFLRSDILARTPHIEIEIAAAGDSQALRDLLADFEGVLEARRIVRGRGWLLAGGGVIDVEVVGYEGDLPAFFPGVANPEPGLYIGDVLAGHWGIEIGDLVEVVSARPTLTPLGPQPRLRQVRLSGTFRTGTTEDQKPRIAVPLDVARRLFGERQTRIELRAAGLEAALTVAEGLARELPEGSRVLTWKDLNRGLFFALKLEKVVMFISVFLIVPIAAMSLVTVLALLISSKRGEIGMLQAMGATRSALQQAFFALGASLGGAGLLLGSVLGIVSAWRADRYQLLSPPGDVYYLDHIPFLLEAGDLAAVVAATAFFVFTSTVWAARKAASSSLVAAWRD